MENENNKTINLFWTGGWDSTFRLLQLIVVYKKKVQPYYIVDAGRKSIAFEIRAMSNIKKQLIQNFPFAKDLILPVKIQLLADIEKDEPILQAYKRIIKKDKIGIQYEWLSRFCKQRNISDMEMCNEASIFPEDNIVKRVFGTVKKIEDGADYHYVLDKQNKLADTFVVFNYFKLVLYNYTKLEMQEMSKKHEFFELMTQTWFCLLPLRSNIPCGKCHPCKTVYREGLKWRLPVISRARHFIWPTLRYVAKKIGLIRINIRFSNKNLYLHIT